MHRKLRRDLSCDLRAPDRVARQARNDGVLLRDRSTAARLGRANSPGTGETVAESARMEQFRRAVRLVRVCYDRQFRRWSIWGSLLSVHSTRRVLGVPVSVSEA